MPLKDVVHMQLVLISMVDTSVAVVMVTVAMEILVLVSSEVHTVLTAMFKE